MFLTGVNYPSHVAETGSTAPDKPPVLVVPVGEGVVVAPHGDITLPAQAPTRVDYEGELAVVIGRAGHQIGSGQGWAHVGGYMVVNDVSARDVQMAAFEDGKLTNPDAIIRSKSFPSFKPLGPGLVTADELPDIGALVLETRVNGELRQRARLGEMIFDVGALIEAISQDTALSVGDLILTGTPGGVGFVANDYLEPGDTIDISIDQIGTIHNHVTAG
jgi:2-keto-4-pentenoate hydratase/2-oxohepta-3-ene-1,7-dioic acid hydratase in catechol pathway